jgi:hypothetical protein
MKITIPVSVGELIDKITILEIKVLFSDDKYLEQELTELNQIRDTITSVLLEEELQLKRVNEKLWKIENQLRLKEKLQQFDTQFIELARQVYLINDKRASIKKRINELTNSSYREIKVHK